MILVQFNETLFLFRQKRGVSPADIAALMVYLHTRETPPEGGTST